MVVLEVLQRAAAHTALFDISLLLCVSYVLWVICFQSTVPLPLFRWQSEASQLPHAPMATMAGTRVTWRSLQETKGLPFSGLNSA